ncbi:MAG: alpha/beta hydrolase [Chloroflexota bacterium]
MKEPPDIPDYSALDRPEILQFVFFPRREWTPAPHDARDYLIPVEAGVNISARLYPATNSAASILYFHGNGEVACDYDWFASEYNHFGLSLFVTDYRGYGRGNGEPTINSMIADSLKVFDFFYNNVPRPKENRLFIMGRSLGSMSVLTIASRRANQVAGLIIESGFPAVTRILSHLGFPGRGSKVTELENASLALVASISLPALVIHGDRDTLIPYEEGLLLHKILGSSVKRMVTIPSAGHNDVMLVSKELYYEAIKGFIASVLAQTTTK